MTSNPMIRKFEAQESVLTGESMSISGAINKTMLLTAILLLFAYFGWTICAQGYSDKANLMLILSSVGGFILALIAAFKPASSPVIAPVYAICEGIFVGIISYAYGSMFNGIVFNAAALTILALFVMLFLYTTKVIQATATFRKVILTSTIAIAIFYLAGFIGALLGHPMTIFNGGIYGIVISSVICVIAALNFILDFDFIERAQNNLPKCYEWYAGLTLLITIVWLYIEFLRLLAQLNSRK